MMGSYTIAQARTSGQYRTLETLRERGFSAAELRNGLLIGNVATGRAELLRGTRLSVFLNGLDVAWRCVQAGPAAEGWVDLLQVAGDPDATAAPSRPGLAAWALNSDGSGPVIERRFGRVEFDYEFEGLPDPYTERLRERVTSRG